MGRREAAATQQAAHSSDLVRRVCLGATWRSCNAEAPFVA
jgi:hypothetical protein